jgi:hypothetical protein
MSLLKNLMQVGEPTEYAAFVVLGLITVPLSNGYGASEWAAFVNVHGAEKAGLYVMVTSAVMYVGMSLFFCAVDFFGIARRYKTQPKVRQCASSLAMMPGCTHTHTHTCTAQVCFWVANKLMHSTIV